MAGTERTASPPPLPHASVSPHRTALSSLLSCTCDCTTFQSTVTPTADSTPFCVLRFRFLDSSSPISKSPPPPPYPPFIVVFEPCPLWPTIETQIQRWSC
ncbi:hypothetical protein K456DRAFT_719475 [Colletotrichum gloeosporioides 23]|nr:hypothetical protein K456DRAFT_719475 [Colletotrichum gloeosporioides 23]